MTMKSYITTKEGLEKLKKELAELKDIRRPEISERIAKAKELGDLSENAEYHDAKDSMAFLEGRIGELMTLISHAQVNEPTSTEFVSVGCRVRAEIDGKERTYTIVGAQEADPAAGKISNESSIGNALLGRKLGEEFENLMPNGKRVKCKILEIFC